MCDEIPKDELNCSALSNLSLLNDNDSSVAQALQKISTLNNQLETNSGVGKAQIRSTAPQSTLKQDQVHTLCNWLLLNGNRAAQPNKEEKEMLANRTGLQVKQVTDWFTNTKRRFTQRAKENNAPQNLLEYKISKVFAQQ